jgi:dephospho-CoA kinase
MPWVIPFSIQTTQQKTLSLNNVTVKKEITALFGEEAFLDGTYNRPFIAKKVFTDKTLLDKLNEIIHPAVQHEFKQWSTQQDSALVFNEAAIIFETGSYKRFDFTLLVTCPVELRISRVLKRDNLTREEVLQRIAKQWSDEKKRPMADFEIINDEKELILPQILSMLKALK